MADLFGDLIGGDGAAAATPQKTAEPAKSAAQPAAKAAPPAAPAGLETKPLTGAAKKIVENMEQSLTVPTATSLRTIPVKVLEENRRLINEYLQSGGRGKASFTHLIGWAIVQCRKRISGR